MTEPLVVGLRPWLPWPLSRWRWWTEPVRAERLAAFRIGLAALLLLDLLTTYLPHLHDYFGPNSLGPPGLAEWVWGQRTWWWSVLSGVEDPRLLNAPLAVWIASVLGLLLGLWTRLSAVAAWVLTQSFANSNPNLTNGGDVVCHIGLFYLMLCPCGAAWSVDAWLRRSPGPRFVHPWVLRLLFLQMVPIYFCNGVSKALGVDWPRGDSLYYVLGDMTLARWSYAQVTVPYWLTRGLTWLVLGWEVSFPLLILWRPLRIVALCFGAAFHLGIWTSLELGGFAPYMLCLYLSLLPWERSSG